MPCGTGTFAYLHTPATEFREKSRLESPVICVGEAEPDETDTVVELDGTPESEPLASTDGADGVAAAFDGAGGELGEPDTEFVAELAPEFVAELAPEFVAEFVAELAPEFVAELAPESSATAIPGALPTHAATPSAAASVPTRPIYLAHPWRCP